MKKIYLTIAALLSWAMMSVAALAVDIIVVSHGQANDPFWSVAKNGVDKACKDMKVSCKYTAPATFDMVEMSKLIDNAISQKPKGIWNSITTYQQIRKQYVSVYQTLETYEEKIELEKAFANVVIELEHNIFQSLSDFFKKGYKVSNYRNAQRFSFLVEKELRLIDTDLEIFFLQKTLQKYLSNMV